MNINKDIALTIVNNLKDAVRYDINLFDTTGTIIASTNTSRIGSTHGAAQLAIETGETVYVDDEHPFAGARNGVNIPVYLYDTVVAVIGMTGERHEVEAYGTVIKKMTEILIRENLDRINYANRNVIIDNLVSALIAERYDAATVAHLMQEADITVQEKLLCAEILFSGELLTSADIRRIREAVREITHHDNQLIVRVQPDSICMIGPQPLVHEIINTYHFLNRPYAAGVSNLCDNLRFIHPHYLQAHRAARWALTNNENQVAYFTDLDFGLLFPALNPASIEQYCAHVFSDLEPHMIEQLYRVFAAYKANNGSIAHIAQELFLHKNTVQNRLNKMAKITGYNPRDLKDFAVLDCAFSLYWWSKQKASRP